MNKTIADIIIESQIRAASQANGDRINKTEGGMFIDHLRSHFNKRGVQLLLAYTRLYKQLMQPLEEESFKIRGTNPEREADLHFKKNEVSDKILAPIRRQIYEQMVDWGKTRLEHWDAQREVFTEMTPLVPTRFEKEVEEALNFFYNE